MKTLFFFLLALVAATSGAQLSQPGGSGAAADIFSPDYNSLGIGSNTHQDNEYLTVTHGATATLVGSTGFSTAQDYNPSFSGPGLVTHLFVVIQGASSDNTCATGSILNVTVDGVNVISNVNLVDFAWSHYKVGGDVSNPTFFSRFVIFNSPKTSAGVGSWDIYFPHPFTSSISITITNGSSSNSMTLWSEASIVTGVPNTVPGARKFWAVETQITSSTTANAAEQYLNVAPGVQGWYRGESWLDDGFPGSLSPSYLDQEGNYRVYIDCFNSVWGANTAMSSSSTIMDANGNKESYSGGTTGNSMPTWPATPGGTVSDGTGTWTMQHGDATTVFQNNKTYVAILHSLRDPSGNLQVCTTPGTTQASGTPVWSTSNGGTTTSGTAVFTCYTSYQRAQIRSTGTEDWFGMGFNFSSIAPTSTPGANFFPYEPTHNDNAGVMFCATQTFGAYRMRLYDKVGFKQSIAIFRQNGDTSENTFTGYPWIFDVEYYTTN